MYIARYTEKIEGEMMNISFLPNILNTFFGKSSGENGIQDQNNPLSGIMNAFMGLMSLSLISNLLGQQGNNSIFGGINNNNFGQFDGFQSSGANGNMYCDKQGTCIPKAKGLDQNFLNEVKAMAGRLNCDYRDLLGVMNAESGLNSQAVNSKSGATGLIQFMPQTAASLGTSTGQLKNMSPTQQLKYVEKYLSQQIKSNGLQGKRLSAGDLYTLVFMPAKSGNNIISTAGTKAYSWNQGLDLNKDGLITKSELGQKVINKRVNESVFA